MRTPRLFLAAAASLCLAVGGAAAQEPAAIHRDEVYTSINGRDLRADVYRAASSPGRVSPVLVYFHGGAWWKGARPESWSAFRPFLAEGMSVVTVEYRLAGEARAPAAVQDARCALAWVATNADRYGFDPRRIVVMGTSAGGHIALLTALLPVDDPATACPDRPTPRPAAVLDYYGPADLEIRSADGVLHPSVRRWLGEGPGAEALQRRLSPIHQVRPGSPPVFIVHGDADPLVPAKDSVRLKKALDAAGSPAALRLVAGGGHGRFAPAQQKEIAAQAIAFLRRHDVLRRR